MVHTNDNNLVEDNHDDNNNSDNGSTFDSSFDSNTFSQSAPGDLLSSIFFKRNRFTSEMENIPEDEIVDKFQSNETVDKFQSNLLKVLFETCGVLLPFLGQ